MSKIASTLFVFLIIFLSAPSVYAIHKGAGGLVCGQCHTMHNSLGSTTAGDGNGGLGGSPGGGMMLLRANVTSRAEIHRLCLQCHASNGSMASNIHAPQDVTVPKVYYSGVWTQEDPFNEIGAGGNFATELDSSWSATTSPALGYGHSLGATNVVPPGGDVAIATFSCTNCHDPHGTSVDPGDGKTNIFRNLKINATGAGSNSGVSFIDDAVKPWLSHKSYVGGVNGAYFGGGEIDNAGNTIWPVFRGSLTGNPVTDSANNNSYATDQNSMMFYPSGPYQSPTISRWCAQCHDKWHENIGLNIRHDPDSGIIGRDYTRHTVNAQVPRRATEGCTLGCHRSMLDRINYSLDLI